MAYDLKGKVALVTGAASGVSAGVAKLLLAEGVKTALITSTLKALELMRKDEGGNGGTIINIASILALAQTSEVPIYSATKAAVLQFSNCIGSKDYYEKTGVRVVVVCFGVTDTALIHSSMMGSLDKKVDITDFDAFLAKTMTIQRVESAAQGVIDAYKKGSSGSTWEASRNLPAVDITENVNKAYKILGEHN